MLCSTQEEEQYHKYKYVTSNQGARGEVDFRTTWKIEMEGRIQICQIRACEVLMGFIFMFYIYF